MMDGLFNGQYTDWLDESIREYKAAVKLLEPVKNMAIISHEQLGKEVFRTTYEDGTYVIVNYGDTAELVAKHTLPAKDYVIVQGGAAK
jgi:hypothetical protein